MLNERLLQNLLRGRGVAAIYRRVIEQVALIADAGAGLIVVTCSSTSPAVDIGRWMKMLGQQRAHGAIDRTA